MTDPGNTKKEFREQIQDALGELQTMADEIRVKLHLAGMDAKDAWHRLEPKLQDFERRAESAGEKAGHDLQEMAQDLKTRFRKLRDDVKKQG